MNPNMESLAAISAGYRRGAKRLEELRRKDIRESNIAESISAFDLAFRMALQTAGKRETVPLGKAQRVLFGIEK